MLREHVDDDEVGICASDACCEDLVLTEGKVFAENGRAVGKVCHSLSSVEHVTKGTLDPLWFSEHRSDVCA